MAFAPVNQRPHTDATFTTMTVVSASLSLATSDATQTSQTTKRPKMCDPCFIWDALLAEIMQSLHNIFMCSNIDFKSLFVWMPNIMTLFSQGESHGISGNIVFKKSLP